MRFHRLVIALGLCLATTTRAWVHHGSTKASKRRSSHQLFMSSTSTPNLLSVDDCLALHNNKDNKVVFVDATWFHKGNRNGRAEFEEGPRIKGARHLDISDIATTQELYPLLNKLNLHNMLPNADLWALTMDAFDITNDSHVIVYGKEGTLFTPRTWFMFRHFGHDHVSLMQGSLEEWMKKGGPVETTPVTVPTAKTILAEAKSRRPVYQCERQQNVVDMYNMKDIVNNKSAVIIDPRGSSFQYGHITGAKHIPYSSLVKEDNTLKSKEQLLDIFKEAGVDIHTNKQIVASCGSGVSVCHILLALEECGRTDNTFMYDGSWQEWKSYPDTPKVLPEQQQ